MVKTKNVQNFSHAGLSQEVDAGKVESFMIFSSCTKGMFCQAGPNLPEHESIRLGMPGMGSPIQLSPGKLAKV